MKTVKAVRCSVKIGDIWESPILHVLITKEDDVYVARCLDFTVSSHGSDVEDALESLKCAIVEYAQHALENGVSEQMIDPTDEHYWVLFRDLELKEEKRRIKLSAKGASQSELLNTKGPGAELTIYA